MVFRGASFLQKVVNAACQNVKEQNMAILRHGCSISALSDNKNAYQHCVALLEFAFYHVSI